METTNASLRIILVKMHALKKKKLFLIFDPTFFSYICLLTFFSRFCIFIGFVYSRENEVCSPKVRNFFHPKDQTKIYLLPGPRKRLFSRSHPEKYQRPIPSFLWIYKLNTSLVQIPAIPKYFASRVSKKIIFEVTL